MGDDIVINISQPPTQPVNISVTGDEESFNVTPVQSVISIGTNVTDTTENVNISVVDTIDNINVNTPYPIGATGASGIQGATGASGVQGNIGSTGASGIQGTTGASGIQGIQGATGTSITILGSLALTSGNEQNDLNNAFPGAIPGNSAIGTNTGDLWVYDGSQWNNVGQIEGPQGATGASGIQGLRGATGASGIQGLQGTTGASGLQGTTGASGVQGEIGATGASGIQGLTGATGASGIQGNIGSTGASGIQGLIGATGASGIQGLTGATGASGIQGLQGTTGASGIQGLIGATGASGIQGLTGATGASGIQGNIGSTGASGIQGNIGSTGASGIQGLIGATGASGIQGNIGATGASGIQGLVGATGASGVQGNIGATGASGIQGLQGSTGASGIQGLQGTTGASGIQGLTGATGASGIQGLQGTTGASGIQGLIGATGASGIQGNIGATGASGIRGSTGPDFVFPNDLTVSLPSPKTFGRYSSGETIPATGKTPAQVIEMAIVQPINPTVNLTTNPTTIPFNQTAVSNTLNFSYTIQSLNANVSAGVIEFKRANQSIWTTLSTAVTSNPGSFIHTFTDTTFNTNTINYRYTVADTVGGITTRTADITIQNYSAPTGTVNVSGNILLPETNVLRERGKVATIINGTVTRNSANVPISAYRIQRNVNNAGWTTIFTNTGVGPGSFSVPNLFDNPTASSTASTIAYRFLVDDSFQANTTIFNTANNTIEYRNLIFFAAVTTPPTNSTGVRSLTGRGFAPIGGTGNLVNPFILNTGSTLLNFTVAMPSTLTITQVLDLDVSNANITSQYINNPFSIVDAGGNSINYNVYTMTIAGAYSFSHRHEITRA